MSRESIVRATDKDEGRIGEVRGNDGTIGECSFRHGRLGRESSDGE